MQAGANGSAEQSLFVCSGAEGHGARGGLASWVCPHRQLRDSAETPVLTLPGKQRDPGSVPGCGVPGGTQESGPSAACTVPG